MENSIFELEGVAEVASQAVQSGVDELNELQLAMIGGGCAEVCPH